MLRVAIPNKGILSESAVAMLKELDIRQGGTLKSCTWSTRQTTLSFST